MQHHVRAARELRHDLALGPAQHERANLRPQARRGVGVARLDWPRVPLLEVARAAEQARVGEVHRAPELLEAVLDGRAAQRDAELAAEVEGGARGLAAEVLDGLGLVEHDDVPLLAGEARRVEPEERVRGQRDLGVGVELALRAVVDGRAQVRAEARDLVGPVVDDALRAHDQRAPAEDAERLEGLSEAHVVGQDAAELRVAKEREPVDALLLVPAQGRVQPLGQRRRAGCPRMPRRAARAARAPPDAARRARRRARRPWEAAAGVSFLSGPRAASRSATRCPCFAPASRPGAAPTRRPGAARGRARRARRG